MTALATDEFAEVVLERKHGCDGVVTVEYITLELDESDQTATADVHFEFSKGTVRFEHGENEKTI